MAVSVYMKGDYEGKWLFWLEKNKANSKPNKTNIPAFSRKSEARRMENVELKMVNPDVCRPSYLKKQSQFTKVRIGVSVYTKGHYEDFHAFGRRKNKANQSQFLQSTYD